MNKVNVGTFYLKILSFYWTFLTNGHFLCFLYFYYSQTSGANGIFSRRLDFSSFNVLPKSRINSYSIKVSFWVFFVSFYRNICIKMFFVTILAYMYENKQLPWSLDLAFSYFDSEICKFCHEPINLSTSPSLLQDKDPKVVWIL